MENIIEFVLYALALVAILVFRAMAQKKKKSAPRAQEAETEPALLEKLFGINEEGLKERFGEEPDVSGPSPAQLSVEGEWEEGEEWQEEKPAEPVTETVEPAHPVPATSPDPITLSSIAEEERKAFESAVYEYKGDFEEIAAGEIGHEEESSAPLVETRFREEIRKAVIYSEILKRKY